MKFACITLDTEPDLRSGRYDIELFRDQNKLSSFNEIIDKYNVKLTGFLVTKLLQHNPSLIETATSSLPIHFEVHSHSHNPQEPDSEKEIDESLKWYSKFFGKPPKGYRAPNGLISEKGLITLAERGFIYDTSIFPSYRFDEYAYNNKHLPTQPYIYETIYKNIIELPVAVIPKIRLILSMSYIKLLSLAWFNGLIKIFGLPDIVIIDSHPHDYFIKNHLPKIKGWKRWAHARNADRALILFDGLLNMLQKMGYKFVYIDELLKNLNLENMTKIDLRN